MKLHRFQTLPETDQFDLIDEQAVFLAERNDGYYTIRLYELDGFYVELYCHSHFNVIIKTKAFRDTNKLEPYLEEINIGELID